MTATLSLTAAGRAALADNGNIGIRAVSFRRLAIGAGIRPPAADDDARADLRDERDAADLAGNAAAAGRIAFRADYAPATAYAVTEIGLLARVGAGADFLLAYWAAEAAADAAAQAAPGTDLVVAGIVEIVSSEADINIAPALNIAVGVPADAVRTADLLAAIAALDIPDAPPYANFATPGLVRLATAADAIGGLVNDEAATPFGVASALAALVGAAPAELNTLDELAAALGDDENFAATVNAALAARATTAALTALAARVESIEDGSSEVTVRRNIETGEGEATINLAAAGKVLVRVSGTSGFMPQAAEIVVRRGGAAIKTWADLPAIGVVGADETGYIELVHVDATAAAGDNTYTWVVTSGSMSGPIITLEEI